MKTSAFAAVALTSAATVLAAAKGVPTPSALPKLGASRSQGCWSAKGDTWELVPTLEFPSSGSCNKYCTPLNYTVTAIHAEECFCGYDYPPADKIVDDKKCNYPCPGYDLESCGAIGSPAIYNVFNTGVKIDVPNAEDATSSTSSGASKPTSTDSSSSTDDVSKASTTSDEDDSDGDGPNTVGIAVGVVVGILLLAGAVGGGYFYMRKKKRQEEAEERRRTEAVSAFVAGSKAGSINGSFADSRLDPVMAHRRMSDGSIADNEDYSRKILRVTNV